jgi:ribose 5-phosphate isomerase RpiB
MAATRSHKIIAGVDSFGCALKDALVSHLRSLDIDVEDLGTSYYFIAAEVGKHVSSSLTDTRGIIAYGTGVGVSIFANKFPGIFAATCLTLEQGRLNVFWGLRRNF